MNSIPEVVQVVPYDNYTVDVYFSDGIIVNYDVKPILDDGVFKVLKDKKIFMDSCTVLNDSLAWDINGNRDEYNCIDIDPLMLHDLPAINDMRK